MFMVQVVNWGIFAGNRTVNWRIPPSGVESPRHRVCRPFVCLCRLLWVDKGETQGLHMLGKGSTVEICLQTLFFECFWDSIALTPSASTSQVLRWLCPPYLADFFPPRQGFSCPALDFVLIHGVMTISILLENRDIGNKILPNSAYEPL